MNSKASPPNNSKPDHLGDYINRAGQLRGKLATIIAHQQESAAGLTRAAAHLRAMANLGKTYCPPENRNGALGNGNFPNVRI